jgi:hypothetical protein
MQPALTKVATGMSLLPNRASRRLAPTARRLAASLRVAPPKAGLLRAWREGTVAGRSLLLQAAGDPGGSPLQRSRPAKAGKQATAPERFAHATGPYGSTAAGSLRVAPPKAGLLRAWRTGGASRSFAKT